VTQEEIRTERDAIKERIEMHQTEADVERTRLRGLWRRCKHPSQFQVSTMGELGMRCPDCGWGN
jgi:hypothetical protein